MWRRFANSLRLRYALRVRFVDEQLASQHISEVLNAPLIESNRQNADVMKMPDGTTHTSNSRSLITENVNPLNALTCSHTHKYNLKEVTSTKLDIHNLSLP